MLAPLAIVGAQGLPLFVGGGLLVAGSEAGLYWVAISIVLSYITTLLNSWVLMVEILR